MTQFDPADAIAQAARERIAALNEAAEAAQKRLTSGQFDLHGSAAAPSVPSGPTPLVDVGTEMDDLAWEDPS